MKMIVSALLAAAFIPAVSPHAIAALRASNGSITAVCTAGFNAVPDSYPHSELNTGRTFSYICSRNLAPRERHPSVSMRCSPGFTPGGRKDSKRRITYVCTTKRHSK